MKVSKMFSCEQLTEVGRGDRKVWGASRVADRLLTFDFNVDPDPVFQIIAGLDAAFQNNANPFGSGSATRDTVVYVTCTSAEGY